MVKGIAAAASTHYSKSQFFVQKFNFDKPPTFSRVFYPNFFYEKIVKTLGFRVVKIEFLDKKLTFGVYKLIFYEFCLPTYWAGFLVCEPC